ncbi:glutathione S-transferase [Stakelama pacifica]|uniref:Glutathione S-transferase n=1 Tax=Stakelama pacifica TaxID=517720 RepID=A0A4R6FJX9_9SPHN|nr:glutathione S-transferase [Stakelama pacifica]TDN81190.1 glutathione S-transferase [Stakelama pacifica]GGO97016.1 glutathione S-transferase [Stakelama pacifica]
MSALPILYSFRRCPYAMRARMGIAMSGMPCELREVKLADKPQAMLAASPKGTVPVLVLNDGRVIDESIDILRHALDLSDPEGWLERDDADLIAANDGQFKHDLDRYKYPDRHDSDPHHHREAGMAFLRHLDTRLAESSNLCGDQRGLADAAIMPFVRQFAGVDRDWFDAQPIPHVHAWLERHLASPLFAQIMLRVPQWQPDQEPVLFGKHS